MHVHSSSLAPQIMQPIAFCCAPLPLLISVMHMIGQRFEGTLQISRAFYSSFFLDSALQILVLQTGFLEL